MAPLLLAFLNPAAARERAPLPELQGAADAVALAAAEGASTYAPLELRYAGEQLDQARQAQSQGDLHQARLLLEQSKVNSDLAVAKSRLGRTREAVQVQEAANARLRDNGAALEQP